MGFERRPPVDLPGASVGPGNCWDCNGTGNRPRLPSLAACQGCKGTGYVCEACGMPKLPEELVFEGRWCLDCAVEGGYM